MYAIEVNDLRKVFRGKKWARVEALKGISFAVEAGEVFGFLGPNGAGKSTTIKSIMGLIRPTSGRAAIMGHDSDSIEARRKVGYLPENPTFYEFLSADEYLDFVGSVFKMNNEVLCKKKQEVLELLELYDAHKRPLRSYSKGMVQRLGLAQVLLHDPEVYVLDEPMSGLDPLGRALVKSIIIDLKARGKSVFFSTHITADVESICDRVGIIVKGELRSVRSVESILTEGIMGYHVRTMNHCTGMISDGYVETDQLSHYLDNARQTGSEIVLVEPNRNNLEEYFLGIVKGR